MASASVPRVPLGVGVGSPLRAPARWAAAPPPGRGGLRRRRADDAGCVRAFDANEGGVPVPPELWARVLGQCAADGARPEKLVEQLLENWLEERSGFAKPSGTFAKAGELERLFSRDEVARLENALARAGEAASVRPANAHRVPVVGGVHDLTWQNHTHNHAHRRRRARRTKRRCGC